MLLAGRLGRFLDAYPDLALELIIREHVGDLITDGIDVAVHFGQPKTTSLIARKLADGGLVTVASPAYLAGFVRITGWPGLEVADRLTRWQKSHTAATAFRRLSSSTLCGSTCVLP
jgi:DNA-binding transcriptional LysR family regulator